MAVVKILFEAGRGLSVPRRQTADSAGYDLCAADAGSIAAGTYQLVSCGFRMQLPPGWEAQVRPRSGLALRHGVTVLNSPGTIDADYRGDVGVLLVNHGHQPFNYTRGMRIGQLVFSKPQTPEVVEVEALDETGRGAGGYGSTGA